MQLSDRTIAKLCAGESPLISPFEPCRLQPSTYDVTLSAHIVTPSVEDIIDLRKPVIRRDEFLWLGKNCGGTFYLGPGCFVLGSTRETFRIPADVQGRMDGKSSLGRDGLMVHITAGVFDAGFEGVAVVELYNASRAYWALYEGLAIGQMSFQQLDQPADRPYGSDGLGSHYAGQSFTTPNRMGG